MSAFSSIPTGIDTQGMERAFAGAAAAYDEQAFLQREIEQRLLERVDAVGLAPARVLDLGAGTGRGSEALKRRFPRAEVFAVDPVAAMLNVARRRSRWRRRLHPVCARAERLPFVEAGADLLFSNLALQWCPELDPLFDELRRVLRQGGALMFTTFGPETLWELRESWAQVDDAPHVNRFVDMHHIGDALLAAGFAEPVMDVERLTVTYADARALMRELKAIGAHNVDRGRRRGLTGKAAFQRMLAAYERHRDADGRLPASYEVVYGYAKAPEPGQPRRTPEGQVAAFSVDRLRGSRRKRGGDNE